MDTSYWNKLNPNIEDFNTSKQFFSQYLWRLAIRADGGRMLNRNKKESLEKAIEHRQNSDKLYLSHRSYWTRRPNRNSTSYDIELLQRIEKIREDFAGIIQVRIEEPNIQFYANDEVTLTAIAIRLSKPECILNITGPANDADIELLREGAILTHKTPDYNYKIVLRDGRYTSEVKQQVLAYLDSLGDEVKLTRSCREMLNKSYPSMWNVYFFAKDPGLATFIRLIDPEMVSNIHELVHVNYK